MMKPLQKAQLEQHKIFQNFPINPAPVAPSAPPLPAGTNPKVSRNCYFPYCIWKKKKKKERKKERKKKAKRQLKKSLAYKNANQVCQRL